MNLKNLLKTRFSMADFRPDQEQAIAKRVVAGFNRPNLTFEVHYARDLPSKLQVLREFLSAADGPGIIYVSTRHEAEEVAQFVNEVALIKALPYHAGLTDKQRATVQDAFLAGDVQIIVITRAFAGRRDRPNVRFVLHFTLPESLETYCQQVSQAGRDGRPARCVLLYSPKDQAWQEWRIENGEPTLEQLSALHEAVCSAAESGVALPSLGDLARTVGLPKGEVKRGLAQLEMAQTLRCLWDDNRLIRLEPGPLTFERLKAAAVQSQARQRRRLWQLRQMVAYAKTTACRRRMLLSYFGDCDLHEAPACCDNCQGPNRLRRFLRNHFFSLFMWPPKDDAVRAFLARPHPLHGPWQTGWALAFHGRFLGNAWERSEIGELTYRYKYRSKSHLADTLVEKLVGLIKQHPELALVDGVVPVPPSIVRAHDPVHLLAEKLAQRLQIACLGDALIKTRLTMPQKQLRTLAQKRANVAGAFAVKGDVHGKRLLVLDDLYDSGATLEEVVRVLRYAGAASLRVLTLTRTIQPDE